MNACSFTSPAGRLQKSGRKLVARFVSEGLEIAYEVHGEGRPIILVHGFASNGRVNWVDTGWVRVLQEAGYGPVTIDNRGHGLSQKVYDPALYPARTMARDVAGLIAHLGLHDKHGPVPVMGYSMGARISAFVTLDFPELVSAAIFGGLGINMIHGLGGSEEIVQGLLAARVEDVVSPVGRRFRLFAQHTGSDLKALAACMQSSRDPITADRLAGIGVPVLVAVGDQDDIGGSAQELADILPRGEALVLEGRDHMRATGDRAFKAGVIDFLSRLAK